MNGYPKTFFFEKARKKVTTNAEISYAPSWKWHFRNFFLERYFFVK